MYDFYLVKTDLADNSIYNKYYIYNIYIYRCMLWTLVYSCNVKSPTGLVLVDYYND